MKRVIVAVQNTLVCEVITYALKKHDMLVEKATGDTPEEIANVCGAFLADVLVVDVTRFGSGAFDRRIKTSDLVKKNNPKAKVCFVCDNVSDADLSYRVANAKRLGVIDAFFYQSVPSDYIADAIDAL